MVKLYSLAEAAELVGVNERAIRLAESEGRLPAPQRDEAGHRMYRPADIERMRALFRRSP